MAEAKWVIFSVGDQKYGAPISQVERILPEPALTPVVLSDPCIRGLFELRGAMIPVLDLRRRFQLPDLEEPTRLVVMTSARGRMAWRVDVVDGIEALSDEQIQEAPELVRSGGDEFFGRVARLGDRIVALLNPEFAVPAASLATAA